MQPTHMDVGSSERIKKIVEEHTLANRFRQAVQYCKETSGFRTIMTDAHMGPAQRMVMERCLTQNFLLKFGNDVFGKRDLLFIDMRGDQDVARMYDMEELPDPRQPKAEEPKEAGGDGGDDDAGEDDE